MQTRGAALTSPAYLPYGIAFDVEKLTWELDFFLKHFLAAYRNAVLPQAEFDAVRGEFKVISRSWRPSRACSATATTTAAT